MIFLKLLSILSAVSLDERLHSVFIASAHFLDDISYLIYLGPKVYDILPKANHSVRFGSHLHQVKLFLRVCNESSHQLREYVGVSVQLPIVRLQGQVDIFKLVSFDMQQVVPLKAKVILPRLLYLPLT